MQTYQVDTHISRDGMISLSSMPDLHNKRVRLVIVPLEEKKAADSVGDASENTPKFVREYSEKLKTLSGEEAEKFKKANPIPEFLRKCSGLSEKDFLAGASDDRQETLKDTLRYEYLKKKYGIGETYAKEEVDDARYEYLMEKHK
ncbi:MAG: hypothetical protein LBL94_06230 [Prevotellaceae bacterium]|nr:hypothetical protein [Prevotellaceae bacterium]